MWLVMALLWAPHPSSIPAGAFEGEVRLSTDAFTGSYGSWAIGEIDAGMVLVELQEVRAGRGDTLMAVGTIEEGHGTAGGLAYDAVLSLRSVLEHSPSRFALHRAGLAMRRAVLDGLEPIDDDRALLAGFLIGDTSQIDEIDRAAMRMSGLAHYVAVSGSNVALFLGLLGVVAGPLALGPRRRAVVGLIGLPVYAAATRFEPSVMRATAMAALALSGRLAGIVLEAWQLLSLAVVVLVLADPTLTSNVGFQLSVAATAGVLVGARWPVRGLVWRALSVTLGAQLAVAPLLLYHFGSVPALSPVVNVLAGPLVAAATIIGALSVAGLGLLVPLASAIAGLVLDLARAAAGWPQLSTLEFLAIVLVGLVIYTVPWSRQLAAPLAATAVSLALIAPVDSLPPQSVVVLDVGQGDSILIHGGSGHYALVDGGPEQTVLIDKLRGYGVRSLDLVVVTHVHADHAAGLIGIVGHIPITRVWADSAPHVTSDFSELRSELASAGVPIVGPSLGQEFRLGDLILTVEGPTRRYASPNDQSIVLTVHGTERSMLLSGDIETFAQSDLEGLRADVLKVPHQGAGTSDPDWLGSIGATTAVISVGPNQFGHPVSWVVELLVASGARVLRTDEDGDVVVDLSLDSPSG